MAKTDEEIMEGIKAVALACSERGITLVFGIAAPTGQHVSFAGDLFKVMGLCSHAIALAHAKVEIREKF